MPRYFFHINDGEDTPDTEGTVLDDAATAHAQAVETAGAILKEQGNRLGDGTDWRMTVIDEAGRTVCDLQFSAHCPD